MIKTEQAAARAAVLIDLDGTLIDSSPGIFASLLYALAQYDIHPARESLNKYLGPPLRVAFADFLPPALIEEAVALYREKYESEGLYDCALYDGVREMLQTLQGAGFALCLATSKPRRFAQIILEHFGLAELFAYIGGASMDGALDTKAQVIRDVLAQPCAQGCRAVMVGDRFHDMEGARLCNLPAIAVLYGYGSAEELRAYAPAFIADTPQSFCEYLLANY
ncbi:MAG: HAD-IA family hydrolase [Ruthenibacterium sp.]